MPTQLAKHGSEAGYRSELETGNVCDRCRNGHRQFNKQYTKTGRKKGLSYTRYDVVDHLYSPGANGSRAGTIPGRSRSEQEHASKQGTGSPQVNRNGPLPGAEGSGDGQEPGTGESRTTLGDRLAAGFRKLTVPDSSNDYVSDEEPPDYLHTVDPDPEPDGEWSEVGEDEIVINKAGMQLIEDNLGTYLSVLGITLDMIDPYCGPILADNLENIVSRWTKVIARYPRAAKLFMSKDGGTLFLWIGALQATWPVLYAIYEHHLSKSIQTDKEGRIFKVRNVGSPNEHFDATTPPMPNYDYTVD